jgi:transcriptional regulator with XRE-family HTH domain
VRYRSRPLSKMGVGFTYVSRIERVETGKMTYGDYPNRTLISRLAEALEAHEDQVLPLGGKIPDKIKVMVLERPEPFRRLAQLHDAVQGLILDRLERQ